MRERYEIQNELNDGYIADTRSVPLTLVVLEDAHKRAFYRHTRIQTEILLDLRDQNERIIELLSQDHSHETRMLATGEIVNVVKRMRHES